MLTPCAALRKHAHKFCGRPAAGSSKSADHILHRDTPLLKYHSDSTGNFKNKRGVGVPWIGPNLSFKWMISKTFS
jgi:hypothetical protein